MDGYKATNVLWLKVLHNKKPYSKIESDRNENVKWMGDNTLRGKTKKECIYKKVEVIRLRIK